MFLFWCVFLRHYLWFNCAHTNNGLFLSIRIIPFDFYTTNTQYCTIDCAIVCNIAMCTLISTDSVPSRFSVELNIIDSENFAHIRHPSTNFYHIDNRFDYVPLLFTECSSESFFVVVSDILPREHVCKKKYKQWHSRQYNTRHTKTNFENAT